MKISTTGFGIFLASVTAITLASTGHGVGTPVCVSAPNSFSPSGATMVGLGSDSVLANDLAFDVTGLPPGELGILLAGRVGPQAPFRDGFLCLDLAPGVLRLNKFISTPTGKANVLLDHNVGTAGLLNAGQTRVFHVLYRDCMSQNSGINSTNGIEVTFTP